jgi:6-pyruvoyltetrahydropterin/6-carboxytetrahydropterin synthase
MKVEQFITKEIRFDAAHRVPMHESKCHNLHGHSYTIIAEVSGELFTSGPQTDMIFDYGFLKQLLMEHIDATCDHGIILSIQDWKFICMAYDDKIFTTGIFSDWVQEVRKTIDQQCFWSGKTKFGKTYIISGAPTAENLAAHFFKVLSPFIRIATNNQGYLSAITCKETPTSSATYRIKE